MISEIEDALKEVRLAMEQVNGYPLENLKRVEKILQDWLYTYVDDGK